METRVMKKAEEKNHKHQDLINQKRKKDDLAKIQVELEARLKTQEYKEMLKRLK